MYDGLQLHAHGNDATVAEITPHEAPEGIFLPDDLRAERENPYPSVDV